MDEMFYVPFIVFVAFVLPIWIVFHYITVWKRDKTITPEDESSLGDLRQSAEKLERRIAVLERILDDEIPDWRQRRHDPL